MMFQGTSKQPSKTVKMSDSGEDDAGTPGEKKNFMYA